MREIKFKVYLKGKIFGYEALKVSGWWSMVPELNPDRGERWSPITLGNSHDFVRVQFTGLRDKDGKEIYEGDVLKGFKKEQQKDGGYEIKDAVRWTRGGFELFSREMQEFRVNEKQEITSCMWHEPGPHANRSGWYYEIINVEITGTIYDK